MTLENILNRLTSPENVKIIDEELNEVFYGTVNILREKREYNNYHVDVIYSGIAQSDNEFFYPEAGYLNIESYVAIVISKEDLYND